MSESSSDGRGYPSQPRTVGTAAALFEHAPQPMAAVRTGEDPHVEAVNQAYVERFEARRRASDDADSCSHEIHLGGVERSVLQTAVGGTVDCDVVSKTMPDGRRTFVVRAIPTDGIEVDAYLQYREITTERIRDQQLAVLRRVLRHDLRNDLTVLLGYAETIAENASDRETRDQAATMVEAASDLRAVATSAGRMQSVTEASESIDLDDAIAKARRTATCGDEAVLSIDEPVARRSVDRRVAVALEELCGTFVDQAGATDVDLSVETGDGWATLTLDSDAALCEQERAALEGRDETKLRHATGLSPWIARWAIRAAGGRLHVEADDERCTVVVAVPVLETRDRSSCDSELRSHSRADD